MTFDQWLDEIENFSTRRERLNEDVDFAAVMTGNMSHNLARRRMYDWLEAAYNVGLAAGAATQPSPMEQTPSFPRPHIPHNPLLPTPVAYAYNRCTKCGLHLSGVMGYVCNDSRCPTFPTVTSTVSSSVFRTKSTEGYNG